MIHIVTFDLGDGPLLVGVYQNPVSFEQAVKEVQKKLKFTKIDKKILESIEIASLYVKEKAGDA